MGIARDFGPTLSFVLQPGQTTIRADIYRFMKDKRGLVVGKIAPRSQDSAADVPVELVAVCPFKQSTDLFATFYEQSDYLFFSVLPSGQQVISCAMQNLQRKIDSETG